MVNINPATLLGLDVNVVTPPQPPAPTFDGVARFGATGVQAAGTGAFDTNLYPEYGSPPANGNYGPFSVALGVITPNGAQTVGTYNVGGWDVEVLANLIAVKAQAAWDSLTAVQAAGREVLVREAAGLNSANSWNSGGDFAWATIMGDGEDPRVNYDASEDSRKHFVSFSSLNQKRMVFDRLRIVTGSAVGAKVPGFKMTISGAGSTVRDIHVLRCVVIASRPDPFGDYTGGTASFPGDEGIQFDQDVARVSVRDCVVVGACGSTASIDLQPVSGYAEIIGCKVDLHYADGFAIPAGISLFGGNIISRPMSLPGDAGGPHCDGIQYLGARGVAEASAFIQGASRGAWQSFFTSGTPVAMAIRNILTSDKGLYQISISNTVGCEVTYCTWLPLSGDTFPLSSPKGGLRFGSLISGVNDLKNSVHRSESNVDAGVVKTGNVVAQTWAAADWTAAFPDWDMPSVPTLQDALQVHAAPAAGMAADGKGCAQNIVSWGEEQSSYVLDYPTPVVSAITLTPAADGFTGTLRTNVGNNTVWYCAIPQAQANPTWREIKERRVPNGVCYGSVWCGRAEESTNLAVSGNDALPGVAYKFCAVAENGWSVQSITTTSNFTTLVAVAEKVATGAVFTTNSAASAVLEIPSVGVLNGDYVVACLCHSEGATPTTPIDWEPIGVGSGWTTGSAAVKIYGRVRDGSEGDTLTINLSAANILIGFVTVLRDVTDGGAQATDKVFSATARATPPLTALAGSALLHIWAHNVFGGDVTLPIPEDLVAFGKSPNGNFYFGVELLLAVSAGVTAARTAVSTTNSGWNTMQVELLTAP